MTGVRDCEMGTKGVTEGMEHQMDSNRTTLNTFKRILSLDQWQTRSLVSGFSFRGQFPSCESESFT